MAKKFPIREGMAASFRADAFNLFNKANLGQPNSCVDCQGPGAGLISPPGSFMLTATRDPRISGSKSAIRCSFPPTSAQRRYAATRSFAPPLP